MAWLRLDAAAFEDRALRRAGMDGKLTFLAAVMLSKVRDWSRDEQRGWIPRKEFDGMEVALHWGDETTPDRIAAYDAAILTLSSGDSPLLTPDQGGAGWWVTEWNKFQPDPTALARKRKERAERWKREMRVTGGHRDNRDEAETGSNGVHENGKARDAARDDRDVTATTRDETTRDESRDTSDETSHVACQDGGSAAPSPARPGAVAVAAPRNGIAIHGGYVPGELGDPSALPDPAAKARDIRSLLNRPAPIKPIRGHDVIPEPPQRIADQARLDALKAEALAKIAELDAPSPRSQP